MRLLTCLLATIASAAPCLASAQSGPLAPAEAIKSCDKAVKTVDNERPAHKQKSALNYLKWCEERGATATAQAVGGTRAEGDTLVLLNFYWVVDAWRDAKIMDAALVLAKDPGATIPARVYSIRHLLRLLDSGYVFSYGRLIAGPRVFDLGDGTKLTIPGCKQGIGSEAPDKVGTPLSSDYAAEIRRVLAAMVNDVSVPIPVRNAAACTE